MKFIDNRTAITVPFEQIQIGECFITPSDNHIHIRMQVDAYADYDASNAVDLVTGQQYYFDYDDGVIAVNAEVTTID